MRPLGISIIWLIFCSWPVHARLSSDAEIFQALSKKFSSREEGLDRTIKRAGNKKIELEVFIAAEGEYASAVKIFADLEKYPNWVPMNFNKRPDGGSYFFQLMDLAVSPLTPNVLHTEFLFDLPLVRARMTRDFEMSSEKNDTCFTLKGHALPNPTSQVLSGEGTLKIFRNPKDPSILWIYVEGEAVFKNWLIYEALPDQLMVKQSGERIYRIIDNYHDEERSLLKAAAKH